MSLTATTGGILLSGADGTTVTIDANGDAILVLGVLKDTNNPNLTVTSEGGISASGASSLGTGTFSFTSDNDNDSTSTFSITNVPAGGNATMIFSGGGTGSNDTFDVNGDINAKVLTIENFATVDLANLIDLITSNGALTMTTNIANVLLSGAGATNTIEGNGDAAVSFSGLRDTNNPNLTITSEGDLTVLGGVNLGSGIYTFVADDNDNGTATLLINSDISGNADLNMSGGGTGSSDTLDINADIDAHNMTIQNFGTVDLAETVDLSTSSGALLASTNVGVINLSGSSGTTNTITGIGDAAVSLGPITDSNNVNFMITSQDDLTLAGATSLGTGTYTITADNENDSTGVLTISGAITGNSTLSGGWTGTSDTLDIDADITTRVLTIQNFSSVDLAASVDLVANLGALTASSNVGVINLSGGSGTTNVIDGNNDAAVSLAPITDDNNVFLTITSEGALTMAGITSAGSGIYTITADNDDDSTVTFSLTGAISGASSLTLAGGGTDDAFDVDADIMANSVTIQNFASVDLAASVDLVANSTAVTANSNVTAINLSGADSTTNTITGGGVGLVNLATITDSNNPNLTVTSGGGITLAGLTDLGNGTYSFTSDVDDDSTSTFTLNGAISGSSNLTLSGGGTGTSDTLVLNANVLASIVTIHHFATQTLASGVTVTSTSSSVTQSASEDLTITGTIQSDTSVTVTAGESILDNNDGAGADIQAGTDATLTASGGTVGSVSNAIEVDIGGQLFLSISGQNSGISAVINGNTGDGLLHLLNTPPGLVIFNNDIVGGEGFETVNNQVDFSSSDPNQVGIISIPLESGFSVFQSPVLQLMDF